MQASAEVPQGVGACALAVPASGPVRASAAEAASSAEHDGELAIASVGLLHRLADLAYEYPRCHR